MPGVAPCLTINEEVCNERGWLNFGNPKDVAIRWSETRGFDPHFMGTFTVPADGTLPFYSPVIYHGNGRSLPLAAECVTVPLYMVVRIRRKGGLRCVAHDGPSLRKYFGLSQKTRVVVSSVAPDKYLERLWRFHQVGHLAELLLPLNIDAVTIPNFSFFEDAPKAHTIYNRSRMLRIAERFSAVSLPVVPHLNAFNKSHWEFWVKFLCEHTQIKYVCKELQTGFRSAKRILDAYDGLLDLQNDIGRAIHPVLFAGQRLLPSLRKGGFSSYTLIDGNPFLKTYKRQFLKKSNIDGFTWKLKRTAVGESLHERLEQVISDYQERLLRKADPNLLIQSELILSGKPNKPIKKNSAPQCRPEDYELFRKQESIRDGISIEEDPPVEIQRIPSQSLSSMIRHLGHASEAYEKPILPK